MSSALTKKVNSHHKNCSKSKNKVKSATHLYMNGKYLEEINFSTPHLGLEVLYLHNNLIEDIKNLEKFENLTHLYLQWNRIKKIQGLDCLRNLRKLYLGYNRISCLENVEKLLNLEELHIEKQVLDGEPFRFDFFSLKSIARRLIVLNISKLGLTSLEPISILLRLKHLIANENCFEDARELGNILGRLIFLERADLEDCPAQKDIHYREKITAGSHNLQFLNGKFITQYSRAFIKRFEAAKCKRRTKSETDTTSKGKMTSNGSKNSVHSLHLQNTSDELSYRTWNSLSIGQKSLRRMTKNDSFIRPKSEYSLEGTHIKEQN